jgi:hypothetical protein
MENYFDSMDDLDISCLYEEKDLYDYFYVKNVKKINIHFFYVSKKFIFLNFLYEIFFNFIEFVIFI